LGVRMVSGFTLMFICGFPIYFGGLAMAALIAVFGMIMVWEWVRMTDNASAQTTGRNIPFLSIGVVWLGLLIALWFGLRGQWQMAILAIFVASIVSFIEKQRRGGALWAGFGALYILLPCLALLWLREQGDGEAGLHSSGLAKLVFVMVIVIAADTFAYLGGSTFKGPKFAPKISPNKTWSGFLSGLILGGMFGMGAAHIIGFSPVHGFFLAIPIILASVLGDLFESAIKRTLDVKDAGGLIPGHGGILDRLDSLMLAAIVASLALLIWPGLWPV
ncbi:MAG: phosphatidate cytidylyltransferase, partial [Robiginitomaculum sp.]|nr:phosphatidate cytidylyltransferase [Robiginitomaculum sp.]